MATKGKVVVITYCGECPHNKMCVSGKQSYPYCNAPTPNRKFIEDGVDARAEGIPSWCPLVMELNEILLTGDEVFDLFKNGRIDERDKMQCLKLLERLEKPCINPQHIAYVGSHETRWMCPLCRQELKIGLHAK